MFSVRRYERKVEGQKVKEQKSGARLIHFFDF